MGLFRKKERRSTSFKQNAVLGEDSPFTYTESYKSLRSNLDFALMNGQLKKLMITSALPNENKTSTCINTAITLAETGAKVVVVDCDLRKSSLVRYLNVHGKTKGGMSNIISGGMPLKDGIIKVEEHGFWAIMAGTIPPNPAELLNTHQFAQILDALVEQFDYVICDTPPVNVVSDPVNVSRCCDAVLMVVRQDYAKKDEVRKAKSALEAVGANIIGSVLVRYMSKNNLTGRYYNYYSDKYGYNYGYGYSESER